MFGLEWDWEWLRRKVPALQFIPAAVITWGFSGLLLIATAFQWRWSDLKALGNRNCAILRTFLATLVFTAILTIGMLCFLSVRDARQTWRPEEWTYVEEARYHAPYGVFLLVAFAYVFAGSHVAKESPMRNRLRWLAMAMMIGCTLFVSLSRAKDFVGYVIDHKGWRTEGPVLGVRNVHAAVRKHIESGRAVLLLFWDREHSDPSERSFEEMAGACSMSLQSATQTRLASREPLAVLVIARDADGAATLSAAKKVIQERVAFRPVARVRHGWLYEGTLPGL